jgi:hypothetical protein
MKKFLLFVGMDVTALGGWHDLSDSFDQCDDAVRRGVMLCDGTNHSDDPLSDFFHVYDWWHVVDVSRGEIVKQGSAN